MNQPAPEPPNTFHAPPERLPPDLILQQAKALGDLAGLGTLLDCMPDFVMILNEQRQIIFGNKALRNFAGKRAGGPALGLRPGEFLECHQAGLAPSGCGTGEACRTCGSVNVILGALAGRSVMHGCRIATPAVEAYDLRIWASPFGWQTGHYALVIAVAISAEKRRQVLERIFFHDILNTAGSIQGMSELIRTGLFHFPDRRAAAAACAGQPPEKRARGQPAGRHRRAGRGGAAGLIRVLVPQPAADRARFSRSFPNAVFPRRARVAASAPTASGS